jgi:hypothetical protein
MTAAAQRWTCARCGVAVGRIDGSRIPLPESWESSAEGELCLGCRRGLAAESAQHSAPSGSSSADRAKARRAGLIEFELRRTPDLPDRTIATACRTSVAAVKATRTRMRSAS